MILRLTAALVMIAGLGAFTIYLHMLGKFPTASVAAQHLRAMKDRTLSPDSVTATTYDAMAALPRNLTVGEYSGIERRAVTLEGYVQRMVRAADDDVHLELVPERRLPGEGNLGIIRIGQELQLRRALEEFDPPGEQPPRPFGQFFGLTMAHFLSRATARF